MDWSSLRIPKENKWASLSNVPVINKWASLYNTNIGSNATNVQVDPNPQATQKAQNIYNKVVGPVSSIFSPLEVGVDALIRKDPNKNFAQRFKEATLQGSDIGGALTSRGMNPLLSMPIGFAASLAIPGLGELGQVKHLSKVDDLGRALNKSDDLIDTVKQLPSLKKVAFNQDSYNALRKFYGVNGDDIAEEVVGDWKVIGDFVANTGKKPYMSGADWVYKNNGVKTNVPEKVVNSLENVRYKTLDETVDNMPNLLAGKNIDQSKGVIPETSATKIYHGTSPEAAKMIESKGFDVKKSNTNSIWFTDNKSLIEKGDVGAANKGAIIERLVDEKKLKLGNWDDYDKYTMDELLAKGYDGVKLPDKGQVTYNIFNPEKLQKISQLGVIPEVGGKEMVTLYHASPDMPKSGNWRKGTYFAPTEQQARYYAESHHEGNISIQKVEIPKSLLHKNNTNDIHQLLEEYPITKSQSPSIPEVKNYKK